MHAPWTHSEGDAGFVLVEVVVALVILAVAAMAAAMLMTIAALSARSARTQTLTAMLANDKLAQLRALTWIFDASGSPRTNMSADVSVDPPGRFGTGLTPSPPDSLATNRPGCVDYLDAAGRWIGTGAVPPSGGVYVRRWNVQPLPADPANSLLLQVLVATTAQLPASATSAGPPRWAEGALLVSLVTRKAA